MATHPYRNDLEVAIQAVHDVCRFVSFAVTSEDFAYDSGTGIIPWMVDDRNTARCSLLKLAAQALLIGQIRDSLHTDTFIADFRDPERNKVNDLAASWLLRMLELFDIDEQANGRDGIAEQIRSPQGVKACLDPGGKIHKGGINPHHRGRAVGAGAYQHQHRHRQQAEQPYRQTTGFGHYSVPAPMAAVPSATGMNKNRVWVLEPVDDAIAAAHGAPCFVSAALFDDGEQVVAAVGCLNTFSQHQPAEWGEPPANIKYGEMFFAIRGHGVGMRSLCHGCQLGVPIGVRSEPSGEGLGIVCTPCPPSNANPRIASTPRGPRVASRQTVLPSTISSPERPLLDTEIVKVLFETVASDPSPILRTLAVALSKAGAAVDIPASFSQGQTTPIWSAAGATLIAQEAGAHVSDADGAALDWSAGRRLQRNRGLVVLAPQILAVEPLRRAQQVGAASGVDAGAWGKLLHLASVREEAARRGDAFWPWVWR